MYKISARCIQCLYAGGHELIAAQFSRKSDIRSRLGEYLALSVAAVILVWQAITCSPTSDEAGHLVSGVAMVRTGDPGFYRVNPPLHKLVSGVAVELIESPELPGIYPASLLGSGSRHEFRFADTVLAAAADDYHRWFWIGRLVRIPLILAAAWLLLRKLQPELRTGGVVAAVLWLSSPFILGHGWAIMPDALAAAVMVLLLVASLRWLSTGGWYDSLVVGVSWGLAIGTKFTFCPLFVLWPIAIAVYHVSARGFEFGRLCKRNNVCFGWGYW